MVIPHFVVWLLNDPENGTWQWCDERGKQATEIVTVLYKRLLDGDSMKPNEWYKARRLTTAAYATAAVTYTEGDTDSAANTAATCYAASYVDTGEASDAYAAAGSAIVSDDIASNIIAVRQRYYQKMRDKLLELLQATS